MKNNMMKILGKSSCVITAALLLSGCEIDENKNLASKVDALIKAAIPATGPGCSVGVIKDGAFIHKAGYGLANMELGVPLTADSIFRMASVSKQFTAMTTLLMAEEGLIDLDEDIRTYLPELADYGKKVSIRSMLGHTSGMGDYDMVAGSYEGPKAEGSVGLKSAAGGEFRLGNEDYLSIQEFYDAVKQVPLHHEPDTKYRYSNFAYFLLAMLVEEVSGKSLRDYADEKMFEPLGMDESFFADDGNEIIKNRATGYKRQKEGGYVTDMTNLFWVGDGGLHTSVNEMLKWDQNFYAPKVGKNPTALMKVMNTPNSDFKNGTGEHYANGQSVSLKDGVKHFQHSGGWLGASTYYARLPDEKFSVVALCNDANHGPGKYASQIIEMYLADKK